VNRNERRIKNMRKIKIETWKSKSPVFEGSKLIGYEDKDENLLVALNLLIGNKKPEEMPKGLDKFRTFSRLSKAFDNAEDTKVLELEEVDYKFLKDIVEKDIPASWGMNVNIMKAIENFLEIKSEDLKE